MESIKRLLNNFANQPNETNMNDLEFDDESVDTPLISPFPHSDNDSDDEEVLNELIGRLGKQFSAPSFDNDHFEISFNRKHPITWEEFSDTFVDNDGGETRQPALSGLY
ncbi:hypothetical protein Tco_0034168 [Tanacetum coccineum]